MSSNRNEKFSFRKFFVEAASFLFEDVIVGVLLKGFLYIILLPVRVIAAIFS